MDIKELASRLNVSIGVATDLAQIEHISTITTAPNLSVNVTEFILFTDIQTFDQIKQFDEAVIDTIKAPIEFTLNEIEGIKDTITNNITGILDQDINGIFLTATVGEVDAIKNAIGREIVGTLNASMNSLTFDLTDSLSNSITNITDTITNSIVNSVQGLVDGVVGTIGNIINSISDTFASLVSGAVGFLNNIVNNLFSSVLGALYGAIFGPLNILAGFMRQFWDALIQIVSDSFIIGQFFFSAIENIPKELGLGFSDIRHGVLPGSLTQRPLTKHPLLPSESDVHRVSRNDDSVKQPGGMKYNYDAERDPLLNDPKMEYDATYPYNHYFETESGHVFEYDDTPSFERIQIKHRSGTGFHVNPDGTIKYTVVGDNYKVVMDDNKVHIYGDAHTFIDGTSNISINGDAKINIGLNADISVGKNLTIDVGETFKIRAKRLWIPGTMYVHKIVTPLLVRGIVRQESPVIKPIHPLSSPKMHKFFEKHDGWPVNKVPAGDGKANKQVESRVTTPDIKTGLEAGEIDRAKSAERIPDVVKATEEDTKVVKTSPPTEGKAKAPNNPNDYRDPAYDQKISEYFYLRDMCWAVVSKNALKSQEGLSIQQIVNNLATLAQTALDPIVELFGLPSFTSYNRPGGPIHFTSGFRRGSGKSWHLKGCAMDIQFVGIPKATYYNRAVEIRDKVKGWDHILLEFKTTGTGTPWIHIGVVPGRANGKCQTFMNHTPFANGFHNLASRAKK